MTTLLASFPSPPRGVWHLWSLPLRAYALFIIVGIIVALIIGNRRWVARGGEPGVVYDIALLAVPFGLIGGRFYHVMTDWTAYFGPDGRGFIAALKIWDGGLGIWGAVALGAIGAWIGCRRRGIPLPAFGDAIAPGIILAQAIGRLGNYFNQELYGRPTTMPWGMKVYERLDPSGFLDVHSVDGVSTGQVHAIVQPTFLYELLWNLLVFIALIYIDRWSKLGHGRLFATYVAGYCVGRFWVELLRDDTATHIAGIRINSFTSTFVFIGAVVYIMLAPKGREDPASLVGKPREPKKKKPKSPKAEAKAAKEPVKAEDSALVEWTKELAVVAAPSGVMAGVAVATEDEDAAEAESAGDVAKADAQASETAASEEAAPSGASAEQATEEAVEEEQPDDSPTAEPAGAAPEDAAEPDAERDAEPSEVSDEAASAEAPSELSTEETDVVPQAANTEAADAATEVPTEQAANDVAEEEQPSAAESAEPEDDGADEPRTEEDQPPEAETAEPDETDTEATGPESAEPEESDAQAAEPESVERAEPPEAEPAAGEAETQAIEPPPIAKAADARGDRRRWRFAVLRSRR